MTRVYNKTLAVAVSWFLLLSSGIAGEPPTRDGSFSSVIFTSGPVSLQTIRESISRWEGYRTRPYKDRGAVCVGAGHNLTANREKVKSLYTTIEIEQYLYFDIARSVDVCRAGIERFDELPQDVQIVALNVAFTVGRVGFERFRDFRLALGYRAWGNAAVALGTSLWYKQVAPDRANWAYRVLLYHATRL